MLGQIRSQQRSIQWRRRLGARVGVRVDKTGQQPSLPDEFSISHRVVSPLIAVCIQIDDIATRQGATLYPQNTHDGTILD